MVQIRFIGTERQKKAVAELCPQLGFSLCDSGGVTVVAKRGDRLSVEKTADVISVLWNKPVDLFRALTYLKQVLQTGISVSESASYRTLCYMADNSRNAVLNMESFKRMIRYLALMGYDAMMLYTEDTYELPDYPHFGFMRGRFTAEELQEMDRYASLFHIELIPCIQTLAHLENALRWREFDGYRDTNDILMVGDERTYALIRSMLVQVKACFSSKRIHLGMDEAFFLGRGEYLKRNGYRNAFDIMIDHLNAVVSICRELDLQPIIWSDMFFHIAFNGTYYISNGELPEEIIQKIPEELGLVYWDYYNKKPERVRHTIYCHQCFQRSLWFAGGAWKWGGFGSHNRFSLVTSKNTLDECARAGVDQIIVTSWGDDGAEASQFSILPSLLYFAERCYHGATDESRLRVRAEQCFCTSYDVLIAFDLPDLLPGNVPEERPHPANPSKYLLYNDPLERIFDCHLDPLTAPKAFADNADRLNLLSQDEQFGYALKTLGVLCRILSIKCDLGYRMHQAYLEQNRSAMQQIADGDIPLLLDMLEDFLETYRVQWYQENKTYGFVTHEMRIGALKERLRSVQKRLMDYLNGRLTGIDELLHAPLSVAPRHKGEYIFFNDWNQIGNVGIL